MIQDTKAKLSVLQETIKRDLWNLIEQQRISNPDVKGCKIFTMSASKLSLESWDPLYYDWSSQFDYLQSKLQKQSIYSFIRTLEKLVETGKVDDRKFHPQVIEKIKAIM